MSKEQSKSKNSRLATASLALGILAIVFGVVGLGAILGILAIVFGAVSLKDNKGKSLTGIITGVIGILVVVTAAYFVFVAIPNSQANQRDNDRKHDVATIVADTKSFTKTFDKLGPVDAFDVISKPSSSYMHKLKIIKGIEFGGLDWDGIQPSKHVAIFDTKDCNGRSEVLESFSVTVLLEDGTKYCQGS